MHPKNADEMANSVDPDQTAPDDQTAPQEQSDLGLHCLLRPICSNIENLYGIWGLAKLFYEWPNAKYW